VIIGTEISGVDRDRTYPGWERRWVGEAIEQLAAVEGGFDFAIDVAYNTAGDITKTFRPDYPRRGRSTSIVLELGTNLRGLTEEIDATVQANQIDVIGAGDGPAMLIETVADSTHLDLYPLLEDVLTYKDVNQTATLIGHGNVALAARATPLETVPTVTQSGPEIGLGSYITGDEVTVRGSDGYIDVEERSRIIEISVDVDDQGGESVGLNLQPASDFV
jgi:hypothetical protein